LLWINGSIPGREPVANRHVFLEPCCSDSRAASTPLPRLCTRRIARLALPAHVQSALFVAWLLLTALIANNSLIGILLRVARPPGRLRHALLPAMLAAHVLLTFQIVLFRHAIFSLERMRGAVFQQFTQTMGSEATALVSGVFIPP